MTCLECSSVLYILWGEAEKRKTYCLFSCQAVAAVVPCRSAHLKTQAPKWHVPTLLSQDFRAEDAVLKSPVPKKRLDKLSQVWCAAADNSVRGFSGDNYQSTAPVPPLFLLPAYGVCSELPCVPQSPAAI